MSPESSAKLAPRLAELRYPRLLGGGARGAQRAHAASTTRWSAASRPGCPFPGRYTRYGDVLELLRGELDDRLVILAPGDEMELEFDASSLPPPPAGWRRSVFLESLGWDKDADRNTCEGHQLEPLPFAAMSGYPFAEGESYPDTPFHRRYREEWLTREVTPETVPAVN